MPEPDVHHGRRVTVESRLGCSYLTVIGSLLVNSNRIVDAAEVPPGGMMKLESRATELRIGLSSSWIWAVTESNVQGIRAAKLEPSTQMPTITGRTCPNCRTGRVHRFCSHCGADRQWAAVRGGRRLAAWVSGWPRKARWAVPLWTVALTLSVTATGLSVTDNTGAEAFAALCLILTLIAGFGAAYATAEL